MIITEKQLEILENFQKQAIQIFEKKFGDIFTELDYHTNIDTLQRFLESRNYDLNKSIEMWKKWVEWRKTFKPHQIDFNDPVMKNLDKTGKLYWHKQDKNNFPIMYYRMKFHVKGSGTAEQHIKYLVYMIDKGCEQSDVLGSHKITVIYDRRGHDSKQQDPVSMEVSKMLTPILQDYYPERLNTFFVLGPNLFFRMSYKVVALFMSEKTRRKATLLAGDEDLLEYIDVNCLLKDYGGNSKPSDDENYVEGTHHKGDDEFDKKEIDEFNNQLKN